MLLGARRPGLLLVAVAACFAALACGRGGAIFGRAYEYEEDLYLAVDGSATVIVNTSIPALVALRGVELDAAPSGVIDRDKLRLAYQSDVTSVRRISRPWRRNGRRFVQIRVQVSDIRKLSDAPPFSWSRYSLDEENGFRVFRQTVGRSALRPGTLQGYGWRGGELVAFRLHLPSRIRWHNARDVETNATSDVQRGNILAWEQLLTDRLDGKPIEIEVRMDMQSILHRTLWLFAVAFSAAVALIGLLLWLTARTGAKEALEQEHATAPESSISPSSPQPPSAVR